MLVNSNQRFNTLRGVFVNGLWIDEPKRVKEEICLYIENRFQEEDWVRPKLDGVRFRAIGQQHNVRLSEPFNAGATRTPNQMALISNLLRSFGKLSRLMCFGSWMNSLFMERSRRGAMPHS